MFDRNFANSKVIFSETIFYCEVFLHDELIPGVEIF